MYKKLLILILSTVITGQSVNCSATKQNPRYVELDFSALKFLEYVKVVTTWKTQDYQTLSKLMVINGWGYVESQRIKGDLKKETCDAQKQMRFYEEKNIDGKIYILDDIEIIIEAIIKNNLNDLKIDEKKLDKFELSLLPCLLDEHIIWKFNGSLNRDFIGYKFVFNSYFYEEDAKEAQAAIKSIPISISHRFARSLDIGSVYGSNILRAFPDQRFGPGRGGTPERNCRLLAFAHLNPYPRIYLLIKKIIN